MNGTAPHRNDNGERPSSRLEQVPEPANDRPAPSGEMSMKPGAARLLDAVKNRGGRQVVVIRGYPDPDSLASAWAHARMAASVGVECDIAHLPLVSRAENRAMVNLLELPLTRITTPEDLEKYSAMSLVDANSIELPRRAHLPFVSIVDHHGVAGKLEADYADVRPHVGSTSTIYAEYLMETGIGVLGGGDLPTRLGTALAYGIRSDTDDLLRATSADLVALASLVQYIDADVLSQLSRYSIPAAAMGIMRRALDAMQIEGTWAVAGVGYVRSQDRDAIGQAADFLLRREGIRTVLAYGIVEGWIDGSLRTNDPGVDPAEWLREAFGVGPHGVPYGGGRRDKGGFQIPLGPLAECPDRRALWRVSKELVEHMFKKRIGITDDEEDERRRSSSTRRGLLDQDGSGRVRGG
jgi:nanoRNase/pAp phosphatase (c-di-AMP/oligoRNAs hydrolase)